MAAPLFVLLAILVVGVLLAMVALYLLTGTVLGAVAGAGLGAGHALVTGGDPAGGAAIGALLGAVLGPWLYVDGQKVDKPLLGGALIGGIGGTLLAADAAGALQYALLGSALGFALAPAPPGGDDAAGR